MKIFITGGSGQLAKSFSDIYDNDQLYLATRKKLDVTNKDQVFDQIDKNSPDIIFHFASMTRGDECTKDPELAYQINVNGTKNIVEAARKNNTKLLFVSTNEVFGGERQDAYTERHKPHPITVVGSTKYEAEKIIRENLTNYFIVRTSWLYSKWSNNFIHAVLAKAKKDKKIELVSDEVSSPTNSLDLAIAIKKLISTKKYGVYHLNNTGYASRLDFAKKAFEIYGINDVEIIPVKLADYKRLSKPPLFTALSNKKAEKIGITLPNWKIALKKFIKTNLV